MPVLITLKHILFCYGNVFYDYTAPLVTVHWAPLLQRFYGSSCKSYRVLTYKVSLIRSLFRLELASSSLQKGVHG